MKITPEMIEAGAQAIAPEVWATDVKIFGHPGSLNRKGHELCKDMVRAQSEACLNAALCSRDVSSPEVVSKKGQEISETRTEGEDVVKKTRVKKYKVSGVWRTGIPKRMTPSDGARIGRKPARS